MKHLMIFSANAYHSEAYEETKWRINNLILHALIN